MKKLLNILIFLLLLLFNIFINSAYFKSCAWSTFSKTNTKYCKPSAELSDSLMCTLDKKYQKMSFTHNCLICLKNIHCPKENFRSKKLLVKHEKTNIKNLQNYLHNNNIFKNLTYLVYSDGISKHQHGSALQLDPFYCTINKKKQAETRSLFFLDKNIEFLLPCQSVCCPEGDFKNKKVLEQPKKLSIENVQSGYQDGSIFSKLSYLKYIKNTCEKQNHNNQSKQLNFKEKSSNIRGIPKGEIKLEDSNNNLIPADKEHSHFEKCYKLQDSKFEQNDVYEEQARTFRVSNILNNISKNTLEKLELLGFSDPSLKKIKKSDPRNFLFILLDVIRDNFKKMLKPLILVIIILAICATFKSLSVQYSKNFSDDLTNIICILAMALFLIHPFSETILYVSDIFKLCCKLLLCYIPIITGIMISSGQCLTSCVHSTFLIGFANLILQISSKAFVPILNALLAFACTCAITNYIDFSGIFMTISKALKILLGILVTAFVGLFSIKVSVNLAAEGAGTKALKFLLGSCVPVVGKALSDAASTIRGSLNLLKTSTCAFFIASMVVTFLPALVQCLLWYVTTSVCSSVGESLQLSKISKLLKNLTEITGIIMTLIICFLAVIIASTLIIMRSACNTS